MLYEAPHLFKPFPAMGEALKGTLARRRRARWRRTAPEDLSSLAMDLCGASPSRAPLAAEILERLGDTGACNRRASCRTRSGEQLIAAKSTSRGWRDAFRCSW